MAQVPFHPPLQLADSFSNERCLRLLEAAAGLPLPDACIRSVRPWTMHAEVANSYVPSQPLFSESLFSAGSFGLNSLLRCDISVELMR